MKKGIIIGVIWLIVINLFGIIAVNRVNLQADTAYPWIRAEDFSQDKTWNPVRLHDQWDAEWFLSIVKNGYTYDPTGPSTLSNVAFFPLYPGIVKLFSYILLNDRLSGFVVSSLALLFACGILYKLVEKYHTQSSASLSVMLLLVFPTAFFLNSVYSESLFLLLSLLFFYFLFEKKIWLAGSIGFLAALTRITGLFLFLPFVIELVFLYRQKSIQLKDYLAAMLIPFGTGLFFLYHSLRFGDFLLYFKIQDAWGRKFTANVNHMYFGTNAGIINTAMDFSFAVFGIVLALIIYFKIRKSYGVYMLSVIIAAIATGTPMSIGRIILVLFPMFIYLASMKDERFRFGWMLLSTVFMALYTLLYVNNYWAG